MRTRIGRSALCVMILILLTAPAFPRSYKAARFDVALVVEPGGNLEITEAIDFEFTDGPFTYASREIPLEGSDGLEGFHGFLDGHELRVGAGERPGLEVERKGRSMRVTWLFPPTSDTSRRLELKYRVFGAVRRDAGSDLLIWNAVPHRHDYRIESSQVTVSYPEGARLAFQPSARRARMTASDRKVVFVAGELGKDHGLALNVAFVRGDILSAPPRWQREAAQRRVDHLEAFKLGLTIALPLVIVGALLIVWLRLRHTTPRVAGPTLLATPPDDLPPALVGAMRGRWMDWRPALATLIRLGERGFVEIVGGPKSRWKGRQFTLRRTGAKGELSPTERAILGLVFGADGPFAGDIGLRKAQRRMQRRWGQFTRALHDEAAARGLLDPDRERARRRWMIGAVVTLLAVAVAVAATALAFRVHEQLMSLAIGVSITVALAILALLAAILGATISPLSVTGLKQKQNWKAFERRLKALTSQKSALQPEWLSSYLPYAIVFGLGNQWARAFKGIDLPYGLAWLAGVENFDNSEIAALISVLSSSGASHSSPGGAGAGAGGGGGSSSAG
jgi:uncharacterized membrane protein YgcG